MAGHCPASRNRPIPGRRRRHGGHRKAERRLNECRAGNLRPIRPHRRGHDGPGRGRGRDAGTMTRLPARSGASVALQPHSGRRSARAISAPPQGRTPGHAAPRLPRPDAGPEARSGGRRRHRHCTLTPLPEPVRWACPAGRSEGLSGGPKRGPGWPAASRDDPPGQFPPGGRSGTAPPSGGPVLTLSCPSPDRAEVRQGAREAPATPKGLLAI